MFKLVHFSWFIAGWFSVAALLTLAGPFETFQWPTWPERAVYWGSVTGIGLALALLLHRGTLHCCARGFPRWQCDLLFSGAFGAAFAPLLYGVTALVAQGMSHQLPLGLMALIAFAVPMAILPLRAIFLTGHDSAVPKVDPPTPRLLERLAPDQRGELLRVSVRDHYVDVVTSAGRTSLLMRFADALRELDGLDGMRVHRSHWVADRAVTEFVRARGKVFLTLRCGESIPVSRTYQDAAACRWEGRAQ